MTSVALIGCGELGGCLLKGLLAAGHELQNLHVVERREENHQRLGRDYPALAIERKPTLRLQDFATVLFCVKPQDFKAACEQALPYLNRRALLVSTVAGARCGVVKKWTGDRYKVVRCMPNLAVAVGRGMSVLYTMDAISSEQEKTATSVFAAVGRTEWVEEEPMMDLATALSGSGPAYFFRFVEALIKAAQAQGMPAELARRLTMQTLDGALVYLQKSGEHASRARQKVSSKGGTTERALASLEENRFDAVVMAALEAARLRACEISDELNQG